MNTLASMHLLLFIHFNMPHKYKITRSVMFGLVFNKQWQFCFIIGVNLCSQKRKWIQPVIVVALIAHHTPTVTLCNGTLWTKSGKLLF